MVEFAKSKSDLDRYIANNKYLVVNFTAAWCGPCKTINPIVDALYSKDSGRYSKVEIVRVDLDDNQEAATVLDITSVPTFLIYENGHETNRVSGANVPELIKQLDALNEKAEADPEARRSGNGAKVSAAASDPDVAAIATKVPKGFEVLNHVIHFGEFEALNVLPLQEGEVKDIFRVNNAKAATVYSDADSQSLFYIPLLSISKVHSVWVKTSIPAKSESNKLDEEELEETQPPNRIKVWSNHTSIPSFEDASSGAAPHEEQVDHIDGWYEFKLKFVRFQNVQSLTILLDGEDEDYHTVVDKILIVGVSGDSKDQGKVSD